MDGTVKGWWGRDTGGEPKPETLGADRDRPGPGPEKGHKGCVCLRTGEGGLGRGCGPWGPRFWPLLPTAPHPPCPLLPGEAPLSGYFCHWLIVGLMIQRFQHVSGLVGGIKWSKGMG